MNSRNPDSRSSRKHEENQDLHTRMKSTGNANYIGKQTQVLSYYLSVFKVIDYVKKINVFWGL